MNVEPGLHLSERGEKRWLDGGGSVFAIARKASVLKTGRGSEFRRRSFVD